MTNCGGLTPATGATATAAAPASGLEIALLAALGALPVLAGVGIFWGFRFRVLYRQDNAMLAALAYEIERHNRQEGAL